MALDFGGQRSGVAASRRNECMLLKLFFSDGQCSCGKGGEWSKCQAAWRSARFAPKACGENQLHGLAAFGTSRSLRGGKGAHRLRGAEENGFSRMQLDAKSVGFGGGMTKAVVADRAQSDG